MGAKFSFSSLQDQWITVLLAAFSALVAVTDFLGLLDSVPFISERVPILTLLLLSALTWKVAFTRPEQREAAYEELLLRTSRIDEKIETSDSLKEIRVREFKDFNDALTYTNRRISQAKSRVNSVYWDAQLNFGQRIDGNNIIHRELFIMDESNRDYYIQNLMHRINVSARNYSCAYFRATKDTSLQFIIVDGLEVIFLSNFSTHNMSVRHSSIVELFSYHYDEMWQKAVKLKQYDRINGANLSVALAPTIESLPADLEHCVQKCLQLHKAMGKSAAKK